MTFINGIFLFFAGQGLFLAFLLVQNKKVKSNPWISLYMASFSFILIYWVISWAKIPVKYLQTAFNIPVEFALGPLFHLTITQKNKKHTWLHFLPTAFVSILWFPYWLTLFTSLKISSEYGSILYFVHPLLAIGTILSMATYLIVTLRKIQSIEQRVATLSFIIYFVGSLSYLLLSQLKILTPLNDYIIASCVVITFYGSGYYYFSLYKPYSKAALGGSAKPHYPIAHLNSLLTKNRSYLDPNYRIQELSHESQVSIKDLVSTIKANNYSNFNEYINTFRIDHAKHLLETTDMKILAVALESGFNNKVSFIHNFKSLTSVTPNVYRVNKQAEKLPNQREQLSK